MPARDDIFFMREALTLAARGSGAVSPNPMVGAVLVRNGRTIGRGYHTKYGAAHAEVECLRGSTADLRQATLYVNLEPCSHYGKTPPCADLLIRSRIGRVVIAMQDPNPIVAGRGIRRLRRAGIKVTVGVLAREAQELNKAFVTHIMLHRPHVHIKVAQSLDGMIAGGHERWITSSASRRLVHQWRAAVDAVVVGAGTVREDDPELSVRLVKGRSPDVVILDGRFSLPLSAALFAPGQARRVFLCVGRNRLARGSAKARELVKRGIEILPFRSARGTLWLSDVLHELYRQRIGSILVEGGSHVFGAFLSEGLVDELSLFVAPRVIGNGVPAFTFPDTAHATS